MNFFFDRDFVTISYIGMSKGFYKIMSRFTSMFLFPRKVFLADYIFESIEMKNYGLKPIHEKMSGITALYKTMYISLYPTALSRFELKIILGR